MSGLAVFTLCVVFFLKVGGVITNICENTKPFQIKKEHLNKRLAGHSLYEVKVAGHHACARECFAVMLCKSVDYLTSEKSCKLNDADSASVELSEFESKGRSIFSDITEWPSAMSGRCGSRPCTSKQKCVTLQDSFTCIDSDIEQILSISNGAPWGTWNESMDMCEHLTYAVGYEMKIQEDQGNDEDTELNGIKLICKSLDGTGSNTVTSTVGPWGTWRGETYCSGPDGSFFLTSFSLQVEEELVGADNSAANFIKFKCREFYGTQATYELSKEPGIGDWGTYGSWSSECAVNSAICGIKTKVEPLTGDGDETALNDVLLLCCDIEQILSVSNGAPWGTWSESMDMCKHLTYAVGYEMKIQEDQGNDEDTELNGIKLICKSLDGTESNTATSTVGPWGTWRGETYCTDSDGPFFLTSFSLQVEEELVDADNSAANFIKFKCRDFSGTQATYELSKEPGIGDWGTYGSWSSECAVNSAICGIKTKVEPLTGDGDETALNDVQFLCCS